nr:reverse transcriptase domain-containing protein [Tanacetum cinerariifolium]
MFDQDVKLVAPSNSESHVDCSHGERTGRRTGRGGRRTGEPTNRVGGQTSDQDGQGSDQDIRANKGIDGAIVYTRWIEKMEPVQEMSGCGVNPKVLMSKEFCLNNEMQKRETEFWCHVMVKAGHGAYSDRFHVLARLVPHLVTPENKRIERPSRDSNVRDDPKRSRTERAFALTTNPVRREYTSAAPKCTNCNFHHHPKMPYHTCTKYNRLGHFSKDCRVGPRMATTANAKNSTAARRACFVCADTVTIPIFPPTLPAPSPTLPATLHLTHDSPSSSPLSPSTNQYP